MSTLTCNTVYVERKLEVTATPDTDIVTLSTIKDNVQIGYSTLTATQARKVAQALTKAASLAEGKVVE